MEKDFELHHGDCLHTLKAMPDNSVDSIVTDPPYGLSFMGKKWDYDVPSAEVWAECLRVLKPGGHLLAFAGTRTQHRMAVRIEDAGFEIRDMIAWVYGSGFPKSMAVSKALGKAAGAEREVVGSYKRGPAMHPGNEGADNWRDNYTGEVAITIPATDAARQWQGWGTALKPALEPITVARKPLVGTVAANVLAHGTGALNIDGCRVGTETRTNASKPRADRNGFVDGFVGGTTSQTHDHGRWPANLIHDGSEEVLAGFPETGKSTGGRTANISNTSHIYGGGKGLGQELSADEVRGDPGYGDTGSAARFFYCAKASKKDRDEGNAHPTVKPADLMAYLCRLVTPPGGIVLDPFMGSGSTGKAAMREGFRFIGCEVSEEYLAIARARIEAAYLAANPDIAELL